MPEEVEEVHADYNEDNFRGIAHYDPDKLAAEARQKFLLKVSENEDTYKVEKAIRKDPNKKRCCLCKQVLPFPDSFYVNAARRGDGYMSCCKKCNTSRVNTWRRNQKKGIFTKGIPVKDPDRFERFGPVLPPIVLEDPPEESTFDGDTAPDID